MKNPPYEIVRAQAEDAAALLEYLKIIGGETDNLSFGPEGVPLDEKTERAYLAMQAESHDNIQLLAKVNGEIIGTASLNRKPNRMHHRAEFGISIDRAYWGRGIGRALTEACIECAKTAGYTQLELDVVVENTAAQMLYEHVGFTEYGRNPRGFRTRSGAWQELILMRLELD